MRNRSITKAAFAAIIGGLSLASSVGAGTLISVTPASAPNGFGSPSYGSWVANAIYAIENGQTSYGTPGTPTYYSAAPSTISVTDNIVTGFKSWKGQANPTSPFANELGNRLLFGLHIVATGGDTFSISQLSFVMSSSDTTNSLGYTFGLGTYNYSDQYVGINYGADGVKGGGDDVRITSGPNAQLVHELVGRGSGNAWAAYDNAGSPGATLQEKINNAARAIGNEPIQFSGVYTLDGATGGASVTLTPVPLPASAMGGLVLIGLGALRRSRQQVVA